MSWRALATKGFELSGLACKILGQRHGLRIAYYHRVNATLDPYYFDTGIRPEVFERQLEHLQSRFRILSLTAAIQMSERGDDLSGCLCLSFDDGFRECFTHIFPALRERGVVATFYLIESCLNNAHLMWRNKVLYIQSQVDPAKRAEFSGEPSGNLLALSNTWSMREKDQRADELWKLAGLPPVPAFLSRERPYLTDSEVREMIADGQEVGLHTKTHPFCDRLDLSEVEDEIIAPAERMSRRFGAEINSLSYPFGRRCSREIERVILQRTRLRALVGIDDRLRNERDPSRWERQGMETHYSKSIAGFYLTPWRRRAKNNGQS